MKIEKRTKRGRRIIVYGPAGVGKSTLCAGSPKPLFADVENGLVDIEVDRVRIENLGQLKEFLTECTANNFDYKTVVIDSLDAVQTMVFEYVASSAGVETVEEIDYGKGFALARKVWRRMIPWFDMISESGREIVLIGHAEVERVSPPGGESYDRWNLAIQKRTASQLVHWADDVLFCAFVTRTMEQKEQFGQKRNIAIAQQRFVFTRNGPAHLAKSRLDLDERLPMHWPAIYEGGSGNG